MHHPTGQSAETPEGRRFVHVAQQGRQPQGAQFWQTRRAGSQSQQPNARRQFACHPHTYIATAHNQHPLTPKAGGQSSRAGGIEERIRAC
jgi:hypothetical protein